MERLLHHQETKTTIPAAKTCHLRQDQRLNNVPQPGIAPPSDLPKAQSSWNVAERWIDQGPAKEWTAWKTELFTNFGLSFPFLSDSTKGARVPAAMGVQLPGEFHLSSRRESVGPYHQPWTPKTCTPKSAGLDVLQAHGRRCEEQHFPCCQKLCQDPLPRKASFRTSPAACTPRSTRVVSLCGYQKAMVDSHQPFIGIRMRLGERSKRSASGHRSRATRPPLAMHGVLHAEFLSFYS